MPPSFISWWWDPTNNTKKSGNTMIHPGNWMYFHINRVNGKKVMGCRDMAHMCLANIATAGVQALAGTAAATAGNASGDGGRDCWPPLVRLWGVVLMQQPGMVVVAAVATTPRDCWLPPLRPPLLWPTTEGYVRAWCGGVGWGAAAILLGCIPARRQCAGLLQRKKKRGIILLIIIIIIIT